MRLRPLLAVALLLTIAGAAAVAQQASGGSGPPPLSPNAGRPAGAPSTPQPEGTGAISGVIIDGNTRRPLAGAVVYLGIQGRGPAVRMSREITDAKGRFVFQKLPASEAFFLNVSKAGYNDGHYGDDAPGGSGVASGLIGLAAGQWFGEANMTLWRPASIAGTVIDEHGEPVVNAHVRALVKVMIAGMPHLASGAATTTDDRGHYRLQGLLNGTYVVTVPSVQSAVPASTSELEIEGLTPEKAARGGDDAPRKNNGAIELDPGHLLIVGNYVTPPTSAGRPQAYPMVFYPGATSAAESDAIVLKNGESREGVDMALRPVPAVRVSGRVDGPAPAVRGLVLRLLPAGLEELGEGGEAATALVAPDGRFTFLNVPAGSYTIDATRSTLDFSFGSPLGVSQELPGTPGLVPGPMSISSLPTGPAGTRYAAHHGAGDASFWARAAVTVGGSDVTDVSVSLKRAVTMHGRFEFEGAGDPLTFAVVFAEPADGRASLGLPASAPRPIDGQEDEFTITGLMPGEYVPRFLGLGQRYAVKSIVSGGVDYSTRPFDTTPGQDFNDVVVTFTDRIITIDGNVRDDHGGVPSHAVVLAFPVARELWTRYGLSPSRIKTVPITSAGHYKLENIPAGASCLVAIDIADSRRWQDPAFLDAAAKGAVQVTVAWGGNKTQDLRTSVIK